MIVGLAYAVTAVVYAKETCNRTADAGSPLNEEYVPLTDTAAEWGATPAAGYKVLKRMISSVALELQMKPSELVVASVIFERAIKHSPTCLSRMTARPLLLGALCLASQVCSDEDLTAGMAFDVVAPYFARMEFVHFKAIVAKTLVLMDWNIPNEPSIYDAYAQALTHSANETTGKFMSPPELFS